MIGATEVMRDIPFNSGHWNRVPAHTRKKMLIHKPSNVWRGAAWRVYVGHMMGSGFHTTVYYSNDAVAKAILEIEFSK